MSTIFTSSVESVDTTTTTATVDECLYHSACLLYVIEVNSIDRGISIESVKGSMT